jgi:glycosyltransferase involved in cell wall biosynthesis
MDTVAVITPVFNGEKYIEACVDSVSKLRKKGFELQHVVVDDGSTDNTLKKLREIKRNGLLVESQLRNMGASKARNVGLEAIRADWVFFLDADDVLFANSINGLLEAACQNNSDWVYGDFVRADAEGRYLVGEDYYGWRFESAADCLTSMYLGEHFFQQNSLYKREVLMEVGGFDDKLKMAEDFDLATRLLLKGVLPWYMSGALYMHRNHDLSLSIQHRLNPKLHLSDVKKLYEKYRGELLTRLGPDRIEKIELRLGV